jgi:hypothetical protein
VIDPQSRPDIHIQPGPNCFGPLFRLESKVAAPLRAEQLRRYRLDQNGQYLVVITKRPPEVGTAWIDRNGIFALRWQDVHRAVAATSAKGRDAYLCSSFARYLEELEMAHREDVNAADLAKVQRLFLRVTAQKNGGFNPADSFRVAHECLGVLDELMSAALEVKPKLAKWSRSGPTYYKWFTDGLTEPPFTSSLSASTTALG